MSGNEIIKKLEKNFNTSLFYNNNFWYYPLLKVSVYFKLFYSKSKKKSKVSNFKQVFFSFLKTFNNKSLKNNDILTVSSSLYYRKKEGQKYSNTFFYFLKDIFPDKNILNLIYFDTSKKRVKDIVESNILIPDFRLYLTLLFSKLKKKQKLNHDKELLKNYLLESNSGIKSVDIENQIQKIAVYVKFYEKILEKTKPKVVIMLWHYNFWNFALTYACKTLKIPVIEFQHGIISKHHLAYTYENVKERELFPDYFFTFGNYFTNEIKKNSKIFKPENIISVGLPYLEEQKKNKFIPKGKLLEFCMNSKIIVVMSQKTIREELREFVLELSKKLPPNFKIIYKIHPSEIDYSKFYKNFNKIENIYLLADNKYSSLDLIKIAEIHTTVHSTTVFEAIALQKKTILLQNKKYNYEFDKFIDNKTIWRVKSVADYLSTIELIYNGKDLKEQKCFSENYYKSNSINNIKNALESIFNI